MIWITYQTCDYPIVPEVHYVDHLNQNELYVVNEWIFGEEVSVYLWKSIKWHYTVFRGPEHKTVMINNREIQKVLKGLKRGAEWYMVRGILPDKNKYHLDKEMFIATDLISPDGIMPYFMAVDLLTRAGFMCAQNVAPAYIGEFIYRDMPSAVNKEVDMYGIVEMSQDGLTRKVYTRIIEGC